MNFSHAGGGGTLLHGGRNYNKIARVLAGTPNMLWKPNTFELLQEN
jgi:hypothetical protein